MNSNERSMYVERSRAIGVFMVGVAAGPSILVGDISGAVVTMAAGFVVFYAGAYMGAVGLVAPLK
jgi:hypothetical protein